MKLIRIIKKISLAVILIYLLFVFFIYFQQRNIIYYPDDQDFYNCPNFNDYQAINYSGTRFYFKELSENVIVHYHGNAGSACDRSFLKPYLESSNYSIIFVEYAGYANDYKKPSKKLILKDVENMVDFIDKNNFKKVVVFGESIGSGPAAYHSYISKVDSLVLISPFYDLKSLAKFHYPIFPVSILLKDNYDNKKWLSNFKGNLLIFHGQLDLIIPYRFSKKLYNSVAGLNKEYVLLSNIDHNSIYNSNIFYEKLLEFLKK